jgi:hypothetical protein
LLHAEIVGPGVIGQGLITLRGGTINARSALVTRESRICFGELCSLGALFRNPFVGAGIEQV